MGRPVCPPQCIRLVPQPGPGGQEFILGPGERTVRLSLMQPFEVAPSTRMKLRLRLTGADPPAPTAYNEFILLIASSASAMINFQVGKRQLQRAADQCIVIAVARPLSTSRSLYRACTHGSAMHSFEPGHPPTGGPAAQHGFVSRKPRGALVVCGHFANFSCQENVQGSSCTSDCTLPAPHAGDRLSP